MESHWFFSSFLLDLHPRYFFGSPQISRHQFHDSFWSPALLPYVKRWKRGNVPPYRWVAGSPGPSLRSVLAILEHSIRATLASGEDGSTRTCWLVEENPKQPTTLRCIKPLPSGGNSNIFYFHPENWGNDPIWLIFFKGVEATNQIKIMGYLPYQLVSLPDFWTINSTSSPYCITNQKSTKFTWFFVHPPKSAKGGVFFQVS